MCKQGIKGKKEIERRKPHSIEMGLNAMAKKTTIKLYTNYILDDNIEIDEMLDEAKTMKKAIREAKRLHSYPIHSTEKSGYFTYVDDPTAKNGRRFIRRSTEISLWTALSEWYLDKNPDNITFRQVYEKWITWKSAPNNQDNIDRIKASWKSYYEEEPLSQKIIDKPFAQITSLDLREWAESLMKKYLPNKKKFARMFLIVNQCYEYACDEDIAIVPLNLWSKARKKLNKSLITATGIPADDTQVFSDEERRKIHEMVYEDLTKYSRTPTSAGLQVLFLLETGLRMGECCGLKWSDIHGNRLYIQRQANNRRVKERPKTSSGFRDIPLTTEALRLLDDIAKFNEEHGYDKEWIFQSANENYDYRLSYNAADRKLAKLCNRLGGARRSPHKCRKTCISTLLDDPNVNNRTVQRFAGHSDINTTFNFYNFDRKSKEEQAEAIDRALTL